MKKYIVTDAYRITESNFSQRKMLGIYLYMQYSV